MDSIFVPGATRVDLDMATIRRYMRKAVAENRRNYAEDEDPWHTLLKLGWAKSESEITRAAYLLFAKEPQLRFSHARTKESIAKLGIDPVKLGFALDTEKSTENSGENTEKSTENSGENTGGGPNKSGKPKRLTETEARIVSILGKQNNDTQGYIATQLGVTRTYVTQIMGNLQTQGVIRRVGPDKGGHWEVIGGEP